MNILSCGRVSVAAAQVLLCASTSLAAVCTVPSGSYPTIQSAVDDPGCTEILLAAQTFVEPVVIARDLIMSGASSSATVLEGRVVVEGATTQAELHHLTVDASAPAVAGCYPVALLARGGAELAAHAVVVVNGGGDACAIFRDGFESGDTAAWSTTMP